jgi:hypothetical protein
MSSGAIRWILTASRSFRMRALSAAACASAMCACSQLDTDPPSSTIITDSAGVRIIQFAMDTARAADLRLAEQPSLSVSEDERAGYQLNRVVDALLLPDEMLAVANAGESQILVFDATGNLEHALGRRGSGPGEYRALAWLGFREPDSLAAGDIGLRRVTLHDPGGSIARTESVAGQSAGGAAAAEFAPQPIGMFGDGTIALVSHGPIERMPGPGRRVVEMFRFDPEAGTTRALGSIAGDELYLLPVDDRLDVLQPPFARAGSVRVGRSDYLMADSDVPEARLHSLDGELRALIRWDGADRRITGNMHDTEARYRYRHIEDGPALEQRLEEQRRMAEHEILPSLGSVHLGADGRVWINRYSLSTDSVGWWYGVDPAAGSVVTLAVPAIFSVLHFGDNEIVVLRRDQFDREIVERFDFMERTR